MKMLKFRAALTYQFRCWQKQHTRNISALYVTGDKAKDNTPPIQPYLDFEVMFKHREQLEDSIQKRKLNINLKRVIENYEVFLDFHRAIAECEHQRNTVAEKLKSLNKEKQPNQTEVEELKQRGKDLRIKLKKIKQDFYPIDDEFVHSFLALPNMLHKQCPGNDHERVIYVSPTKRIETAASHMENKRLVHLLDNETYYMLEEAAIFDIDATHAFSDYLVVNGNFIQTFNPDFAHRVLLEANGTPLESYHKVQDKDENKLNPAYLVGGGAFESFLGDAARMVVYPNVLPLRYAGYGRNYRRKDLRNELTTPNLYTVTQSNTVHAFVATATAAEAEQEMENILNIAVDFYKGLGIHFRIVYVEASKLTIAESLRASIQIYSPAEKRYIQIGHISNYGDFVSKRILFTMHENKNYNFLHLVGGPVMYTTRLIAALIEHDIALDKCKLLGHFETDFDYDAIDKNPPKIDHEAEFRKRGIDVLKGVFK